MFKVSFVIPEHDNDPSDVLSRVQFWASEEFGMSPDEEEDIEQSASVDYVEKEE